MTSLHVYFHLRQQQAFQRLLVHGTERGSASTSTGLSTSGGKSRSWKSGSPLKTALSLDVNARDHLGRTVLHLACTAGPDGLEYVRMLLKHPLINVNIRDAESNWTPLHRALYVSNFAAAIILLQRADVDPSLKDFEGYTAFDVYNSTIPGTKPDGDVGRAELFTWGSSRNAGLGQGDGDDRVFPERVSIPCLTQARSVSHQVQFAPANVQTVHMSRYHTAVVTSESQANVRVCGFGIGGRMGRGHNSLEYTLKPLNEFSHQVTTVALGQDHTLVLVRSGEVFSFGLNHFSQLGYVVESTTTSGRMEEPMQVSPRKIQGPLRKEHVEGVAATKTASACWTETDLYTWGTNRGQLGYDKSAQPVQVLPRKVTKVSSVVDAALSDSAMLCLLATRDVILLCNDQVQKIILPTTFPRGIQPYRPTQSVPNAFIRKVSHCEDTFGFLSSNGEVFTFVAPNVLDLETERKTKLVVKPTIVWSLRKQFTTVKDFALGSNGTIVLCTEAGHVYVRSRDSKLSQGSSKGQRIPYLQRVIRVCASSTGALGAVRVDSSPLPIEILGGTLAEDSAALRPYIWTCSARTNQFNPVSSRVRGHQYSACVGVEGIGDDGDEDSGAIKHDIASLLLFFEILSHQAVVGPPYHQDLTLPSGADTLVHVDSQFCFPVHAAILAARSSTLKALLTSTSGSLSIPTMTFRLEEIQDRKGLRCLRISGCSPLAVLVVLDYIYTDNICTFWDPRVSGTFRDKFPSLRAVSIKQELEDIARALDLDALFSHAVFAKVTKIGTPPKLEDDFVSLLHGDADALSRAVSPDVVLQLSDKKVSCYSCILRSRSEFFCAFFDEPEWTAQRRDTNGVVTIDMKHLNWHVMHFVFDFMCCGDEHMFDHLDFVQNEDDIIDFMFEVMAAANELLLDRLVLIASKVILSHITILNACYILSEASFYHATTLKRSVQQYVIANIETFLESRMLDDLPSDVMRQLMTFARETQATKLKLAAQQANLDASIARHSEWLALQDFPEPLVVTQKKDVTQRSPLSSSIRRLPSISATTTANNNGGVPAGSDTVQSDDIFEMDDAETTVPLDQNRGTGVVPVDGSTPQETPVGVVDMKLVMAEEASRSNLTSRTYDVQDGQGYLPKPVTSAKKALSKDFSSLDTVAVGHSPRTHGPWRSTTVAHTTTSSVAGPSCTELSQTPPRPKAVPLVPSSSDAPRKSGELGPTITPSKLSPKRPKHTGKRTISASAWTSPPAEPATRTVGMSFAEIQQAQLHQRSASVVGPRKSLREIQDEEWALQREAEFLKWWEEEERRVKEEMEAVVRQKEVEGTAAQRTRGKKRYHPRRPRQQEQKGADVGPSARRTSTAATT
ncbi:hypothetical protein FISHEDRAFT_38071 [Fistulina hepatica ATCC 64428]|nr:hypothetical protein FISHEDRAFT_38071 [Fistulina hepatica ATCC 64428]